MRQEIHPVVRVASTVNYHLLQACNMSCGFCFATFLDTRAEKRLKSEESAKLVDLIGEAGFGKINFAGGEPTLLPYLPELIKRAKSRSLVTSIVTNGSRITPEWLDGLAGSIDMIALSIDSVDAENQRKIGRVEKGRGKWPISEERYLALGAMIRERGIRLKVNTVVNRENRAEDMRSFIVAMRPERWKIFQALPVAGQNDARIGDFAISDAEFWGYAERNRGVERDGIAVVPESNELMTGSYVMIDPEGRFYDNATGRHRYSKPILEAGVDAALNEVAVDTDRFLERGGRY